MPNMSHNKNNKSQEVKNELNLTSFEEKVAEIIALRIINGPTPSCNLLNIFNIKNNTTSLQEDITYGSNSPEVNLANKILTNYNNLSPKEKTSANRIIAQANKNVKEHNNKPPTPITIYGRTGIISFLKNNFLLNVPETQSKQSKIINSRLVELFTNKL